MEDRHPGEALRDYLIKLYPKTQSGFLYQIDRDFKDGESILDAFYRGFINYLLRRLIVVANSYYRKFPPQSYGERYYKDELEKFFTKNTRYQKLQIRALVNHLWDCMYFANKDLSDNDKRRIRLRDQRDGRRCYICGTDLEYNNKSSPAYPSVDHKWPRSLGGRDREDNLASLCQRCNSAMKKDYIDWSDYHFEEIALPSLDLDDFRKQSRKGRADELSYFEAAVLAKTEYRCSLCGSEAHRVGRLVIDRMSEADGWHFLNLQPYCPACHDRYIKLRKGE